MAWPRFEELSSSPTFQINRNGNSVNRRFKVAKDDVATFCQYLCDGGISGWSGAPGASAILANCYLDGLDVSPYAGDDLNPISQTLSNPLTDYNGYSWWQVNASYSLYPFNKTWPTTMPKPSHDTGTTLSCKLRGSVEYKTYSARYLYWSSSGTTSGTGATDTTNPVPMDMPGRFVIPIIDVSVTWDLVTNPPVATWMAAIGRTNFTTYMGFSAQTLLLDSYDLNDSMRLSLSNPYAYSATLNFRFRWPGWNYEFCEAPAGWRYVLTADGYPRYPVSTFVGLFNQ